MTELRLSHLKTPLFRALERVDFVLKTLFGLGEEEGAVFFLRVKIFQGFEEGYRDQPCCSLSGSRMHQNTLKCALLCPKVGRFMTELRSSHLKTPLFCALERVDFVFKTLFGVGEEGGAMFFLRVKIFQGFEEGYRDYPVVPFQGQKWTTIH